MQSNDVRVDESTLDTPSAIIVRLPSSKSSTDCTDKLRAEKKNIHSFYFTHMHD